ncbi:hypothetical protein [Ktedonobacter sp. SOSP1-85]|uniref:hypothetical protein n=1 Tax=Ktedonobacter sp. SOSP1-85 TaxID=2778367 RepID=UPI001915A435|nr:hypothetical protein [Ktedonobacter sp. SOSP1-85]
MNTMTKHDIQVERAIAHSMHTLKEFRREGSSRQRLAPYYQVNGMPVSSGLLMSLQKSNSPEE